MNDAENRKMDKRIGVFFLIVLLLLAVFYFTWDGWLYEWQSCGYQGINQHFDLDFFDHQIERTADGKILYPSTNNLHNLIYICYIVALIGCFGLITNRAWLKQGAIAIYPISMVSLIATLLPLSNHLYIVQIAYDIVHVVSIILGMYCLYREKIEFKKTLPGIFITWIFYLLARIVLEPWPYWLNNKDGYFSLNQINDMPFYFYGLEYFPTILILLFINGLFAFFQNKKPVVFWKMLFPILCCFIVGFILMGTGLIQLQNIDMSKNCP